jgi:hypothetical protein
MIGTVRGKRQKGRKAEGQKGRRAERDDDGRRGSKAEGQRGRKGRTTTGFGVRGPDRKSVV